jgi:hypothetical protein
MEQTDVNSALDAPGDDSELEDDLGDAGSTRGSGFSMIWIP